MKEAMPELPPIYEFANKIGMTFKQAELIRERDSMWQARLEEAVRAEKAQSAELRETLEMIAAQGSALPGSTSRVDCMAALAAAAIRAKE